MNKLLDLVFSRYGYTEDFLRKIEQSKYVKYLFKDEDKLVLQLKELRRSQDLVVIMPDFDMDGISAGIIFYAGLSLLGLNVKLYAPDVNRGYGIHVQDIDVVLSQYPNVKVLLTCDVGITALDAIAYAKSKDLKVFVTDHHIEGANRSCADLIVDPSRNDEVCDFNGVCGAFVAYHVLTIYAELTGNPAVKHLISHLSLFACFGSMGDLMPLQYDTRQVVKDGMQEFSNLLMSDTNEYFGCSVNVLPAVYRNVFLNLRQMHYYLIDHNYIRPQKIDENLYGFTYCPMFNSVKRMGDSIEKLYHLLYDTFDHQAITTEDSEFANCVEWLYQLNEQRKVLVDTAFADMLENIDSQPYAPFMFVTDLRPGLLGLLAMKMMSVTGMPTFVVNHVTNGFSGSGRIPTAFHPAKLLKDEPVYVAGHAYSFGINVPTESVDDFYASLTNKIKNHLADSESSETIQIPVLSVSDAVSKSSCDFILATNNDFDTCMDYAYEIANYGPFGSGFPEPSLCLYFKRSDVDDIMLMGTAKQHIRYTLANNIRLIWFNGRDFYDKYFANHQVNDDVFGFVGKFQINNYFGNVTLQFLVSDVA